MTKCPRTPLLAPRRLAVIGLLASLGSATAQLSLSPTVIDTTSPPGAMKSLTVSLANTGKTHLSVTATANALAIAPNGMPLAVDDAPRSCKQWLKLSPETFELDPGQGRLVRCNLQAPTAAAGGYYAMLSFLGVPPKNDNDPGAGVSAGFHFSYRVMTALLVTVPGPQLVAKLESGEPVAGAGDGGRGYTLTVPLRNSGNTHARVEATVTVLSEAGVAVDSLDLAAGGGFLLPEQVRQFRASSTKNLPDGFYIGDMTLRVKQAPQPMRNRFPFLVQGGVPRVAEMTEELRAKLRQEAAGFLIGAPRLQVSLRGGGQRTQSIELRNLTREPIHLRARLLDWQLSTRGEDVVLEAGREPGPSACRVLSLRQTELELPPQGRQSVPLTVALPRDAVGCCYAAVTFDRTDAKLDDSPAALARRSVLVEVISEGTGQRAAEITDFRSGRLPSGAVAFGVKVKNTGNVTLTPDALFALLAKDGNEVANLRLVHDSQTFLQAGGTLILEGHLETVVAPGSYTAQVFVQYGPNLTPLTKRMAFDLAPATPTAPATSAAPNGK